MELEHPRTDPDRQTGRDAPGAADPLDGRRQRSGPQVVVIGAGFGGLTFCKKFSCPDAVVTVVDQHNHHLFQPLLYQVATAGLSAPEIAQPIRSILRRRPNVTVLMREVTGFDLDSRRVLFGAATMSYDYLVLALGSVTSFFGHADWAAHTCPLKSLSDALEIRRRVLMAFERAESGVEPAERRRLMTIVIVGGGPTGIEMAGALAELTRHVLRRDFRRIDPSEARIILLEAGPRLLPQFSADLSENALKHLRRLGAEVETGASVTGVGRGWIRLSDGRMIESENLIWSAGVQAHPLTATLGVALGKGGLVRVREDLSLPGHPEVFAIGDMAEVMSRGRPVPGLSPAAMQMARYVARIITAEISRKGKQSRDCFVYRDKGIMATVGRSAAVAEIRRLRLSGRIAWMAWLIVHLIFLIGFRNKLAVLLQWTYAYLTYKRGARLIV